MKKFVLLNREGNKFVKKKSLKKIIKRLEFYDPRKESLNSEKIAFKKHIKSQYFIRKVQIIIPHPGI